MKSSVAVGVLNIVWGIVTLAQQHDRSLRRAQETSTCTIDGVTYQEGESLGDSFSTRCGAASDWPCYCSPTLDPPVECPYCGIPDLGQGLVCARDGESVSIVNLDGIQQLCSCNVGSTGTPEQTCVDQGDDEEVCTIEVFDGRQVEFENGESFGQFLPTRCKGGGEDYPCFCNTSLPDQVECPYCTFVDVSGDLVCARSNETIIYEDTLDDFIQCTCFDGTFSSCLPVAPTVPVATTRSPTISPTILDGETSSPSVPSSALQSPMPSTAASSLAPTTTDSIVRQPTIPPSRAPIVDFDKASLLGPARPPIPELQIGGCLYPDAVSKSFEFIEEGAVFGQEISGPCSPHSEWPVYCNPNIPGGGLEYPYCVFSTLVIEETIGGNEANSTGVVCARSEERVLVTKPDGTTEECSCLYFNPLLGAVSSCTLLPFNLSFPAPTQAPTIAGATPVPTSSDGSLNEDLPIVPEEPTLVPSTEVTLNDGDDAGRDNNEIGSAAALFPSINFSLVMVCTLFCARNAFR
jgi:hypothetical protein